MTRKYTFLLSLATGAILLFFAPAARAEITEDKTAAIVFSYHNVGDDAAPDNLPLDLFREHIDELRKGGFAVLPLGQAVAALHDKAPLPAHAVVITFDNPSRVTMDAALPVLEDNGLPYTIFFAPDTADWKKIKSLRSNKRVTLGLLPGAYARLVGEPPEKTAALLNGAVAAYRDRLGAAPEFFAWPYGEYSAALKAQLAAYRFKAAFGQHSGVLHAESDPLALPRFTMTNEFGDLSRFMLTAAALPLPVSDVIPADPLVTAQNPPHIGFTVTGEIKNLKGLSCFASGIGKLPLTKLEGGRVEIRPDAPFTDRRTRINCTLPDAGAGNGVWRWLGFLFTLPGVPDEAEEEDDTEEDNGNN